MSATAFALPRESRADRPTPGIALTATLAGQDALLPPGVRTEINRDNSRAIRVSVANVQRTLIEGAALTVLIARAPGSAPAAWTGLFAGAGYFALGLSWIVEPFLVDVATTGWMAPFAVVLLAGGLGLFWPWCDMGTAAPDLRLLCSTLNKSRDYLSKSCKKVEKWRRETLP